MAMSETSVSELKKRALFRVGELTDGTSPYDSKALEYINQIYRAILAGGNEFELELGSPWSWARAQNPATFVLQTKVSGLVSVTNASSTISFVESDGSGGFIPFNLSPSVEGQWFKVTGRPELFRVVSHVSGTSSAVIDTAYTDITASGLEFDVYFVEYDLPVKVERIIAPMVVQRQQQFAAPKDGLIYQVDLSNMNDNWPMKQMPEEVPQQYAILSRDSDGDIRVRMNAQAGSQTRISFDYIPIYSPLVEISPELTNGNANIDFDDNGLINGAEVMVTENITSSGFTLNQVYYVVNSTKDTFQLSTTKGGSAIVPGASGTISISSIPILPKTFRDILDYGASFYVMLDKNDERSEAYFRLCQSKMKAMIAANNREMGQASAGRLGEMIPRMDMYTGPRRYWRQEPSS